MDKQSLEELKIKLQGEKNRLEKDLSEFATRNPKIEGDWKTKYPEVKIEGSEDAIEDGSMIREEYEVDLGVEHILEKKLQDVDQALERIESNSYGVCSNCQKKISMDRLKAAPEAERCMGCES